MECLNSRSRLLVIHPLKLGNTTERVKLVSESYIRQPIPSGQAYLSPVGIPPQFTRAPYYIVNDEHMLEELVY